MGRKRYSNFVFSVYAPFFKVATVPQSQKSYLKMAIGVRLRDFVGFVEFFQERRFPT